jgi:hypothetical protein
MLRRQDVSSAAAADLAAINTATAATALAKQTPEMSLNTTVLFWGITRASTNGNGKGITPNSFLKELESRQTRHNWTDPELLRYVQSCPRGEADLWWTGTLSTNHQLLRLQAGLPPALLHRWEDPQAQLGGLIPPTLQREYGGILCALFSRAGQPLKGIRNATLRQRVCLRRHNGAVY